MMTLPVHRVDVIPDFHPRNLEIRGRSSWFSESLPRPRHWEVMDGHAYERNLRPRASKGARGGRWIVEERAGNLRVSRDGYLAISLNRDGLLEHVYGNGILAWTERSDSVFWIHLE